MNKVLTQRVGDRASRDLRTRRRPGPAQAPEGGEEPPAPRKKRGGEEEARRGKAKLAVVSG